MKRYCANDVAVKKLKLSEGGDAYDVKIEGKNRAVGYLSDKKAFETTPEFFKDNFFAVKSGKE